MSTPGGRCPVCLECIVALRTSYRHDFYLEATGQAEQAAAWRKQLAEAKRDQAGPPR
jgi:hypothetical protein